MSVYDPTGRTVQPEPLTLDSRWCDGKGREWRIVEKQPFGRNLCTTTDGRTQGEWTHREIRAAHARQKESSK